MKQATALKKNRSIKIHSQSGYNYSQIPAIMLSGKWLRTLGFEIGDYISVSCENGRLVITPDVGKAAMKQAEAEFMEKEMKELQKRFAAEKEKLRLQFVAEHKTEYGA